MNLFLWLDVVTWLMQLTPVPCRVTSTSVEL